MLVTFGLLSRSSELSVMKACGISLYRIAAPLLILSLVWSGVLFGLEQRILARANEQVERLDSQIRDRPPRTSNPLNRTWLIGRDGDIYHYTRYDPQSKALQNLTIYRPAKNALAAREPAVHAAGDLSAAAQWIGTNGWQQDFAGARPVDAVPAADPAARAARLLRDAAADRRDDDRARAASASSTNRPPAASTSSR